jgi:hypothetical protein
MSTGPTQSTYQENERPRPNSLPFLLNTVKSPFPRKMTVRKRDHQMKMIPTRNLKVR